MFAAVVVLLGLGLSPARGDTVILTNGRTLEGLVAEENAEQLVLDFGAGTITLQKAEIARVKRSVPAARGALRKKYRDQYFDTGRWVPKGAEKLFEDYQGMRRLREAALDAKRRRRDLFEQGPRLEAENASLKRSLLPLNESLRQSSPQADPGGYNSLVGQVNSLSAQIRSNHIRLEGLVQETNLADQAIRRYLEGYAEFERATRADPYLSGAQEPSTKDRSFYDGIQRTLKEWSGDFAREELVSKRAGPHLMVDALLNGKVTAHLLVDTGATLILLSQSVADRLGLDPKSDRGQIQMTVADGRVVTARAVQLDSVAVGDSRLERVEASILPESAPPAKASLGDGLLGMSFLRHFLVQVDSKAGKLILTGLK